MACDAVTRAWRGRCNSRSPAACLGPPRRRDGPAAGRRHSLRATPRPAPPRRRVADVHERLDNGVDQIIVPGVHADDDSTENFPGTWPHYTPPITSRARDLAPSMRYSSDRTGPAGDRPTSTCRVPAAGSRPVWKSTSCRAASTGHGRHAVRASGNLPDRRRRGAGSFAACIRENRVPSLRRLRRREGLYLVAAKMDARS
jgi:hypothetical protein